MDRQKRQMPNFNVGNLGNLGNVGNVVNTFGSMRRSGNMPRNRLASIESKVDMILNRLNNY